VRTSLPLLKEDVKTVILFESLHSGQSGFFLKQSVNAVKFTELISHSTICPHISARCLVSAVAKVVFLVASMNVPNENLYMQAHQHKTLALMLSLLKVGDLQ